MTVRVMVVADHPIWREGVARDLAEREVEVVATAPDGAAARWTPLLAEDGQPFALKAEGATPAGPGRLWVVVDVDELGAEAPE